MIGRLVYLSNNQFMHDPHAPHLDAMYCILRYLKSAPGKGILFSNHSNLRLEAFTDTDWASSIDDRLSTSRLLCICGGKFRVGLGCSKKYTFCLITKRCAEK